MKNINKIIIIVILSIFYLTHSNAVIKDGLFATVGNKAVTQSDIMDEIKIILILSAQSFSEDKRAQLERMAIQSTIRRHVKEIEIEKFPTLTFNPTDLENRLKEIADRINISVDELEIRCTVNEIDFSMITDQIKIELLWNSLIYEMYKDRLTINQKEIDEQLSLMDKDMYEYLLSEIIIKSSANNNIETEVKDLKKKIENEGFEDAAINSSISDTAIRGGDLGWIAENTIINRFKSQIINTQVGNISEPILIEGNILIYKVRGKRKIKISENYEDKKKQLINIEKNKILNMHSASHLENLKRNITINYY